VRDPDELAAARERGLPAGALPKELASFVGREHEIVEVGHRLQGARLLTLIGAGGIGKTRLALEVAERQCADFADGARFVNLAPINDAATVAQATVSALGLRQESDRAPLETLINRLETRHLLVVLDNCEHVLSGCAALASALLSASPDLRILATSREPLGVAGEAVWAVPPLRLLDRRQDVSVAALLASEAGRLFVERAASAQSTFVLRTDNVRAVAEICWQLDGIPLAIELAAVRVRGLTVAQIASRLGDQLRLLSGGSRASPSRHSTLRAAIDWSYRLLSEGERRLFNRLSVFAGGWTLQAAEAVCSGAGADSEHIVDLLTLLVDRGLVQADEQSGAMRYRLFETLRQYGSEQLSLVREEVRVRERHRAWCLRLAEEGERDIWRADQLECVARLEREQDNVRAALTWTLSSGEDPDHGLRIAAAMVRFWDVHGDLREGMRWLCDLLVLPGVRQPTLGWARAVTARAYLTILSGDGASGMALLDETLPFWRALGDPRGLSMVLFFRGLAIAWTATDIQGAVPTFTESLGLARQRGPRWTAYFCLYCLGEAARLRGDLERADALLTESLSLSSAAPDRWGAFHALYGLAFLNLERGDFAVATTQARQSLTLSVELGDTRGSTYALETLACVMAAEGHARGAARLFGAAAVHREPLGDFASATLQASRERALAAIRARLGERELGAASAEGRRLSFDQAIALARGTEPPQKESGGLSLREREVALLVARGLSNREIAETLVLTERTVESHLTHIFGKLGLRSRSQLTAWAIEQEK
jgi:non-specific serine/threonine protein kinase